MARNYYTPGVYVEEISTLAPSVAQVATAIPAFIGYTEKGSGVKRIDTLLDYETIFGTAQPSKFSVEVNEKVDSQGKTSYEVGKPTQDNSTPNYFLMYYGLSLYFRNGGGSCYIVSVGNYDKGVNKTDFSAGLEKLEKEDEPTLIVLLDAVNLSNSDYYALCVEALSQCNKLQDRFLIADVPPKPEGDTYTKSNVDKFRDNTGTSYLNYGATYHPYLQTLLNYQYQEEDVAISGLSPSNPSIYQTLTDNGIKVTYTGNVKTPPKLEIKKDTTASPLPAGTVVSFDTKTTQGTLSITISSSTPPTGAEVVSAWNTWKGDSTNDAAGFDIQQNGDGTAVITTIAKANLTKIESASKTLKAIQTTNTALYSKIKLKLNEERVILPPSPAIAGIYARVDRERGVWKTPANVSVAAVLGPVSKISNNEQDGLNIDPTAGKSINVIRDFTGKGTLVWGGRTLAGNDNEWRYVSVRRLFITIEESTRKATSFAVFEPNDATTWLKVKAMIESYLYGLWEQGALSGSKPESAYFVNVGLGKTMTTQDILEGRMNVEIGIAAVRPAEFIILKFTHKLQQA